MATLLTMYQVWFTSSWTAVAHLLWRPDHQLVSTARNTGSYGWRMQTICVTDVPPVKKTVVFSASALDWLYFLECNIIFMSSLEVTTAAAEKPILESSHILRLSLYLKAFPSFSSTVASTPHLPLVDVSLSNP